MIYKFHIMTEESITKKNVLNLILNQNTNHFLSQFNKLKIEFDTLAAKKSEIEDNTKIPIQSTISQQITVAIHIHPLMKVQTKREGWLCDNCHA